MHAREIQLNKRRGDEGCLHYPGYSFRDLELCGYLRVDQVCQGTRRTGLKQSLNNFKQARDPVYLRLYKYV